MSPHLQERWTPLRKLLAVDPGDVHVGMAEFIEHDDSWECDRAYELEHEEAADVISQFVVGGKLDVLVVERFALYADKAKAQIGSEMLTAQLIGVIKYIHRLYERNRQKAQTYVAETGVQVVECKLVFQPASIQKPTRAILRAKGVPSESKGNTHALSAELHGWSWILRHGDN